MIKIDLDFIIKDMKGADLIGANNKPANAADLVISTLEAARQNRAKFMAWAMSLVKDKTIELDNADLDMLIDFISNKAGFPNISVFRIVDEYLKTLIKKD